MADRKKLTVSDTPNARDEYAYELWWRGGKGWKFLKHIWVDYSYEAFMHTPGPVWSGMVHKFRQLAIPTLRKPYAGRRWEGYGISEVPSPHTPILHFNVMEVRDVEENKWQYRRGARANQFIVRPPMNFLRAHQMEWTTRGVTSMNTMHLYTMPGGVALNQNIYEEWAPHEGRVFTPRVHSVAVNESEAPLPDTVAVVLDKALEEGLAGIKYSETLWGFGTAQLYMKGYAPRDVDFAVGVQDGGKKGLVYVRGLRGCWGEVTLHGPLRLEFPSATLQLSKKELQNAFISARPQPLGTRRAPRGGR